MGDKVRKIIYQLLSILVISLLNICIGVMVVFLFSPFFPCGNSYLTIWEGARNRLIVTICILGIQVLILRTASTEVSKVVLYFLRVAAVAWFIPLIVFGNRTLDYSTYYRGFDEQEWKSTDYKPFSMIRVFFDEEPFEGMKRNEIELLLGKGYSDWTIDENEIGFRTDAFASPIVFTFDEDSVLVKMELECYD